MKKHARLLLVFSSFALTVSGCFLQSLHPLIAESEPIEGLVGIWKGEEGTWYFLKDLNDYRIYMGSDDKPYPDREQFKFDSYHIYYVRKHDGKTDSTDFIGYTKKLNGNEYIDLYPREDLATIINRKDNSFVNNHFFPVHTFSKIRIQEGQLTIEPFDDQWIRDLIVNNRVRLKHELVGEVHQKVLITASTEELQKFVIKYGNEENAFDDPIILKKIR